MWEYHRLLGETERLGKGLMSSVYTGICCSKLYGSGSSAKIPEISAAGVIFLRSLSFLRCVWGPILSPEYWREPTDLHFLPSLERIFSLCTFSLAFLLLKTLVSLLSPSGPSNLFNQFGILFLWYFVINVAGCSCRIFFSFQEGSQAFVFYASGELYYWFKHWPIISRVSLISGHFSSHHRGLP